MTNPTAAIIIIGDEILSGRTQDTNTQYIAKALTSVGIDLVNSTTIADHTDTIVETVKAASRGYDYVFTTGGIGPTHDDITSTAIASAFELPLELNDEAYKEIKNYYDQRGLEVNEARKKMAYIPKTATLINNSVSGAPGFVVSNVYVLPGVPNIMQPMISEILPTLKHGIPIISVSVDIMVMESIIASDLSDLQTKYSLVQIGSYPFENNGKYGTTLVLRSANTQMLKEAHGELKSILNKIIK
ncbi:MAG: competence/damage-inducible protein A [Rickettsiaceae bacterium]|nr:MAG: competence/damage-inducible protein A [Rickettsiaceae bacterium]